MKILLASHGNMAEGIKSSLNIILGASDTIDTLCAYISDESLDDQIKAYVSTNTDIPKIILTDLYGGSVNQRLVKEPAFDDSYIISGMNLALALELSFMDESSLSSQGIINAIESSREQIQLTRKTESLDEGDDFDF